MPVFRKSVRTLYGIRILPQSATTANTMRTRLKKSGAVTGINVTVLFYSNRKNFKKALNNSSRFKLTISFVLY